MFDNTGYLCYIRAMEIDILKKAGLTDSQAKGYLALIQHGALTPTELAKKTGESRTNAYAIIEKLEKLGLALKKDGSSKTIYTAAHPSAIEALAEKRRKIMSKNEQDIKQNMSSLIDLFYSFNELPGSRTLNGVDGIKTVYDDTLRDKKDIYLLRTTADVASLNKDYLDDYRKNRAKSGINTYAITPDTDIARYNYENEDKEMLFHRTFLTKNDSYTAPVEIDVYGDKVALIAFGETQMATIITSPPIAEAMRQILKLLANLIEQNKANKISN